LGIRFLEFCHKSVWAFLCDDLWGMGVRVRALHKDLSIQDVPVAIVFLDQVGGEEKAPRKETHTNNKSPAVGQTPPNQEASQGEP
jgi:hypothetical protein